MSRLLAIIFLCSCSYLKAQVFVEYLTLGSYSKEVIESSINYPTLYDVSVHKVLYMTPNLEGEMHIASGLFCLPDAEIDMPLLCYQHGTVASRDDVPSNLEGGFTGGLAFASQGYAVVMPDYLGLGESPGVHPYIHADSEAWVAVDFLRAAFEMQDQLSFTLKDQLFVTGYSQGGHASMALQKSLEENPVEQLTITAGAHMSGPYSISEKMIDFTLGDEPYNFVAYLAWVALSVQASFPDLLSDFELEDIFKEAYIDPILRFKDEEINLLDLNIQLLQLLSINEGQSLAKLMLKEEILAALFNNPSHPFSQALQRNDVDRWAPQMPTRMFYCTADDQVTYQNAVFADSLMQDLNAPDVEAIDVATNQDHGGCVRPATIATLEFFNLYSGLVSSVENTLKHTCAVDIVINQSQLKVESDCPIQGVQLSTISGRVIQKANPNQKNTLAIERLSAGLYILSYSVEGQELISEKVWLD